MECWQKLSSDATNDMRQCHMFLFWEILVFEESVEGFCPIVSFYCCMVDSIPVCSRPSLQNLHKYIALPKIHFCNFQWYQTLHDADVLNFISCSNYGKRMTSSQDTLCYISVAQKNIVNQL